MQSASWHALLARIPPEQQFNLMLVTNNGIEISIQSIIRVEGDFLVLRGRMAGSDLGRTLFMPFEQITYIGFQKAIKEVEVRAMFGEPVPEPVAPIKVEEKPAPAPELPPAPVAADPSAPPPASPPPLPASGPKSSTRIPLPSKNAMLERLRARSQANANANKQP